MTPVHYWRSLLVTFLLSGLFLINSTHAATLEGQVIEIHSGDRITVKKTNGTYREVKLVGIRIPSLDKQSAQIAKRHLGMLLAGHYISVEYTALSSRGFILGTVLHGGSDIALRMLSDGLAMVANPSRLPPSRLRQYEQAEATARMRGLGFWQKLR
jgi:endonuclease YncB( thermonuclease family)